MGLGISGYGNMYNWQYSPFGAAGYVSPSITYPVDTLGSNNDMALFFNNAGVDRFVADSTYLSNAVMPSLNNIMANMAQSWQNMMLNISRGNSSWNFGTINGNNPFSIEYRNGVSSGNGSQKIKESEIISGLEKMGKGKAVSEIMNQKITLEDGTEITLLERLLDLVNEYRKDPENAELSEENYNKIWEIVDRYTKNGDLSTADIKVLKNIALDPGSKADKNDTTKDITERPYRNGMVVAAPDTAVNPIVEKIMDSMYCGGTKKNDLENSFLEINKDNVLEILNAFEEKSKFKKRGGDMTLVEKIFDEMNGWDGNTWFMTRDKAKVYVSHLSEKLIERTQELIASGNCDDQTIKEFNELISKLNGALAEAGDSKNAKPYKEKISNAFNALAEMLTAVEKDVYKEYDKALDEGNL